MSVASLAAFTLLLTFNAHVALAARQVVNQAAVANQERREWNGAVTPCKVDADCVPSEVKTEGLFAMPTCDCPSCGARVDNVQDRIKTRCRSQPSGECLCKAKEAVIIAHDDGTREEVIKPPADTPIQPQCVEHEDCVFHGPAGMNPFGTCLCDNCFNGKEFGKDKTPVDHMNKQCKLNAKDASCTCKVAKGAAKAPAKAEAKPPAKAEVKPPAKAEAKPVTNAAVKPDCVVHEDCKFHGPTGAAAFGTCLCDDCFDGKHFGKDEKQFNKMNRKCKLNTADSSCTCKGAEAKPPAKAEVKPPAKAEVKPPAKVEVKPPAKVEVKPPAKVEEKPSTNAESKPRCVVDEDCTFHGPDEGFSLGACLCDDCFDGKHFGKDQRAIHTMNKKCKLNMKDQSCTCKK